MGSERMSVERKTSADSALVRVLLTLHWPGALGLSTSILGWMIASDDHMVLEGPVRVRLLLDRSLPVEAVVSEIKLPVTIAPIQARVDGAVDEQVDKPLKQERVRIGPSAN